MDWLKEILEDNSNVVAAWPAWKRGESEGRMAYDEFTAKMVRRVDALERALAEKDATYQQLMEKAVAIAEFATRHTLFDLPCKFLASPEVQAWRKEREI